MIEIPYTITIFRTITFFMLMIVFFYESIYDKYLRKCNVKLNFTLTLSNIYLMIDLVIELTDNSHFQDRSVVIFLIFCYLEIQILNFFSIPEKHTSVFQETIKEPNNVLIFFTALCKSHYISYHNEANIESGSIQKLQAIIKKYIISRKFDFKNNSSH